MNQDRRAPRHYNGCDVRYSALIFVNLFAFATAIAEPKNFVAEVRYRV